MEEITDKLATININKGTGAGGKNTNLHGKKFEDLTDNAKYLKLKGYEEKRINKTKYGYYLYKIYDDKEVFFVCQKGLRNLLKEKYNFTIFRDPDEAYIVIKENTKPKLFIVEKKEQNVEGSVEIKLWAASSLRWEYNRVTEETFDVEYIFCLSNFYKKKFESTEKKYELLLEKFRLDNIQFLYGSDLDYQDKLEKLIEF